MITKRPVQTFKFNLFDFWIPCIRLFLYYTYNILYFNRFLVFRFQNRCFRFNSNIETLTIFESRWSSMNLLWTETVTIKVVTYMNNHTFPYIWKPNLDSKGRSYSFSIITWQISRHKKTLKNPINCWNIPLKIFYNQQISKIVYIHMPW